MEPAPKYLSDTSPKAERIQVLARRRMTAAQSLAQVLEMTYAIYQLQMEDERRRDPLASDEQIFRRAAARRLGWELVNKVYGRSGHEPAA